MIGLDKANNISWGCSIRWDYRLRIQGVTEYLYLVSTENLLVFVIAAMDVYDIVSDTNDCSLRCP